MSELALNEVSLLAAFLVGLGGGVHCVGMCGGIVAALSFGAPESVRGRPWRFLPYLAAYNGGRVLSYVAAGTLIGGLGALLVDLAALHRGQLLLQAVAGLFMIALGLYLGGWWHGLVRIERLGGRLWRYIEPFGRRLLPIQHPGQAFALGLLWGWLPCGLVYSVLIWSLSAGSAEQGALLMLAFGLGTLPNLMAMGLLAARLAAFTRLPAVRWAAGALVMLFGVLSLARIISAA